MKMAAVLISLLPPATGRKYENGSGSDLALSPSDGERHENGSGPDLAPSPSDGEEA
jgi:hypothetical protein